MSTRTSPPRTDTISLPFSVTNGQPFFDWNAFLRNPPEEGSKAYFEAAALSRAWVSCACGNQCSIVPRYGPNNAGGSEGSPMDGMLRTQGGRFYLNIRDADWSAARLTLAAIERRSAQLIAELQ